MTNQEAKDAIIAQHIGNPTKLLRQDVEKALDAYALHYSKDREQREWVRVKDGLPERMKSVICYNGNYMYKGYFRDGHWHKDDDKKVDSENGWGVTHWMPLPSPPTTQTP